MAEGTSADTDRVRAGETSLVSAVRRHWRLILVTIAVCGLAAVAVASLQRVTATATASIIVQDPATNDASPTNSNFALGQVDILSLPTTTARAATALRRVDTDADVTAESFGTGLKLNSDRNLITISYTATDPQLAQRAANAVITAYRETLADIATRQQHERLKRIDDAIRQVTVRLASATDPAMQRALDLSQRDLLESRGQVFVDRPQDLTIVAVSPAELPSSKRWFSLSSALAAGIVLGLAVGLVAAYAIAVHHQRFGDRFDPAATLDTALLAEISHSAADRLPLETPVLEAPESAAAEAFRIAATMLGVRQTETSAVVVGIASGADEATTLITTNLALAAVSEGRRIAVVDTAVEGRGPSSLLHVDNDGPGVAEALTGAVDVGAATKTLTFAHGHTLSIITPGNLETQHMRYEALCQLLAALRREYELVLLDAPSILRAAHAATLVRACDGAILVLSEGSQVSQATEVRDRLHVLRTPLLGYIYTKASPAHGLYQRLWARVAGRADRVASDVGQ